MNNNKIWIDLDNSPHVPFFYPIIKELEEKNYEVITTARDCFQVCGLADKFQMNYKKVGRHYGANIALKAIGTVWRSFQLFPYIRQNLPVLSVSHGSRSLQILSNALKIPSILIFDYEHASRIPFFKPTLGMAPEIIDVDALKNGFSNGVIRYPGLKEDVYISSYQPDQNFLPKMNLSDQDTLVTIRPPATEAHYHNPEAESLFTEVVEYLGELHDVKMIILPRNEVTQKEYILKRWAQWCENQKIVIPEKVVNGLDMIWHSDFVISGGGTMNREAAALGVPVYSIFRGKMGAVDKYLSKQGRLTFIEQTSDVRDKIIPIKRERDMSSNFEQLPALEKIVTTIEKIINDRNSA